MKKNYKHKTIKKNGILIPPYDFRKKKNQINIFRESNISSRYQNESVNNKVRIHRYQKLAFLATRSVAEKAWQQNRLPEECRWVYWLLIPLHALVAAKSQLRKTCLSLRSRKTTSFVAHMLCRWCIFFMVGARRLNWDIAQKKKHGRRTAATSVCRKTS